MSRFKTFALASCLGVLAVAFVPARADEWNKKTILTVNEPIALPNTVLEPGKYVMKLMDSQSNRHIVQVFTDGEQKLITTILAVPNYRIEPANDTSFSFWETAAGQPRALRSWFYPGDNFGQEFAYPKDMALKIAKATNQNVPAIMTDNSTDADKAEVRTMTPSGETQELAENAQPQTSASAQSSTDTTTAQSNATASTDQSTAAAPSNESASSSMTNEQSATTESPSNGQNVHAMPENNQTAQSTETTTSQSASSTTETTTSQSANNNSDMSANTTDNSVAASAQAGSPSTQAEAAGSVNRSELPRTASPLPLTGLAGLGAAAAALAARVASKR